VGPPTDKKVLENFYRKTRPFGLWGPLKDTLTEQQRVKMEREHFYDILAVPFVLMYQVTLFLLPMLLIVRNMTAFKVTLAIFLAASAGVYLFWYKKLPSAEESQFDVT